MMCLGLNGMAMDETIFLHESGITVTNARFIVKSQTYVLSGITSVKQAIDPARRGVAILSGVVGGLVLFARYTNIFAIVFGVVAMGLAVVLWKANKDHHHVVLRTSSGESLAVTSTDRAFIHRVIEALNAAIAARG